MIKQSADGMTAMFGKSYSSGATTDVAQNLKLDSNGDIWLFGRSEASINLGGNILPNAGNSDAWLLKLNPAGEHLFSRSFGGAGDDRAQAFAIDASDNLVLTFFSVGGFDLGGGILPPAGSVDAIIAKFAFANNNLVHLWSATYGDAQPQTFQDVTTNANGDIATGGNFQGTLAFDSTVALTLSDAGGDDGFVATFAP